MMKIDRQLDAGPPLAVIILIIDTGQTPEGLGFCVCCFIHLVLGVVRWPRATPSPRSGAQKVMHDATLAFGAWCVGTQPATRPGVQCISHYPKAIISFLIIPSWGPRNVLIWDFSTSRTSDRWRLTIRLFITLKPFLNSPHFYSETIWNGIILKELIHQAPGNIWREKYVTLWGFGIWSKKVGEASATSGSNSKLTYFCFLGFLTLIQRRLYRH